MNRPTKFLFQLVVICFFTPAVFAQYFNARDYPQKYFIYPVKDVRISLSANFGELRTNHYHMGLDCRTDQAENKTVVAAADGYVSRVSVGPFGFGLAIYINHPNGLTTVYGHLNKFFPALDRYVKQKQYEQESWQVNLELNPTQFPVKKGQFIALSGNTGGSAGPHVHFEIRDTRTEKVLNPLLFGMPIPDNVPPTIVHLYMFDRCKSTYEQSPLHIPLRKVGNKYVAAQSVITAHTDKVSFGITANDKQSGSTNPNGIYQGTIFVDNKPLSSFLLDSISYDETRYLNAHIDYKTKLAGGPYIQHLSRLPGYPEGVYKDIQGDGVFELNDSQVHPVKIEVKDANGNTSVIEFSIKKGLIRETGRQPKEAFSKEFFPGFVNVFEEGNVQIYMPADALYDSLLFRVTERKQPEGSALSSVFTVASPLVPIQSYMTVRLKADAEVADDTKALIRRRWKGSTETVPAIKEGEWYTARFRTFGEFDLVEDHEPPVITGGFPNGANLAGRTSIVFTPKDNNNVIKNFRAELDGKWLMFSNDKGRNFIYRFDENCPKGKHELKIYVEDAVGNATEKVYNFTR
ncbi:MAG TPA: M23 family metallopeptidase [Ginsengibacter sp.]|nr:M23 family metallopeptidase [Ginsengibacter sp.]HRP43859.1 M23 family metallopeptidase [Ginsengibacter sp.]